MTWVKVCGLTREEDVIAAGAAGADAVGLVLVPSSPRVITLERATHLAAVATTKTVLLVADATVEQAAELVAATGVDGVQPYGDHAASVAAATARMGHLALLPLRPRRNESHHSPDGVVPLFDAPAPGSLGGTGRTFDWELLHGYQGDYVLAGGLGPENVARAVGLLRPWGVDASSGLERAPGIKDHSKVAAFIEEAKSA